MLTDDALATTPRDEWKDRALDEDHVAKCMEMMQQIGSVGEQSVWVIDDAELANNYKEFGMGMFTRDFCLTEDRKKNLTPHELHLPALVDDITAWIRRQPREIVCGNHTFHAAKRLKAMYPKTKTFQTLTADILLVNSKDPIDNEAVGKWAHWDNIRSALAKISSAMERVIYLHNALQRKAFFVSMKYDQYGDIVKEHGYFATLTKYCIENWKVDSGTVNNYLQIAKAYGEEWDMLLSIMQNPPGKSRKDTNNKSCGAYFHVGSKAVPRGQRIALWTKYIQGSIDTKQMKLCFLEIKQTRALQESVLKIANSFRFKGRDDWDSWLVLTQECPSLTQRYIEQNRGAFKPARAKKNDSYEATEVIVAPSGFKTDVVNKFKAQMNTNKRLKDSQVQRFLNTI
jgi:hypothetical protein